MKKISRIRILMIVSQLLLTVFLGYWLYQRFIQERIALHKELAFEFKITEDMVFDSLTNKNIIDSILANRANNDESPISFQSASIIMISSDSTPKDSMKVFKQGNNLIEIKVITDDSKSSTEENPQQKKSMITVGAPDEKHQKEILLQGIKALYTSSNDNIQIDEDLKFSLEQVFDTALFRKTFQKKIGKKPLVTQWVSCSPTDTTNDSLQFVFTSSFGDGNHVVRVKRSGWQVLKTIMPSIIFAILLLSIVGIAFTISFRMLKKQYMLNTIRNDFVGNISHELKTPIATVKLALEALQKYQMTNDVEKTAEYIEMARLETERLDTLVRNVLVASMQDKNGSFLQCSAINVVDIFNKTAKTLKPRLSIEQASLTIDIDEDADKFMVYGDDIHLTGVFLNIIDNSLKYGTRPVKIDARFEANEDNIQITITDNGPGVPNDYVKNVFDKFFRVPTGDNHKVKGHGLGLSYARKVIESHKGSIQIKNTDDNSGCRVIIKIPVLK